MIDPEVASYYERRPEEARHESGPSQLEAARTRSLLSRHLPQAPATILDVGGAAGAYAIWLAGLGYDVHLVDPVQRLVDEAKRRSIEAGVSLASCSPGDARWLDPGDGVAAAILLLGPLYHLTTRDDRAQALSEALRVLQPGGVLFAAAISRWASALDALGRDLFSMPGQWSMVESAVRDGQHRNPSRRPGGFTTAYFHEPDELRAEIAQAGFDAVAVYAVEGMAGFLPDFDARWSDPRQRADMIRLAEMLESEPALLGATPHLLAVGRKRTDSVG